MAQRRFLQFASVAAFGFAPLGALAERDTVTVPACPPVAQSQPAADASTCDARALAEYSEALQERILGRSSRALVRVEFDDRAQVRAVCVDERTGRDNGQARRTVAEKLVELGTPPVGPSCVAGRRIDLNRYEAKLAETKNARSSCSVIGNQRMKALQRCEKYPSDWILYDRVGSTRPYLYVKSEDAEPSVTASATLSRCARTEHGFDDQSKCIQSDGFELLTPPER
jgi:hypothetical protein